MSDYAPNTVISEPVSESTVDQFETVINDPPDSGETTTEDDNPDFELPRDSNGLPYGPIGVHFDKNPQHANAWKIAYENWRDEDASDEDVKTVERRDKYLLKTFRKINQARIKKDPTMPTFAAINQEDIPHTLEDINVLRPKLNNAELDLISTFISVSESDPGYPSKTDCYSPSTKSFYHKVNGKWCVFNKDQYITQLVFEGFDGGTKNNAPRGSEVSEIIREVSAKQITLAGAWSGHAAGLHKTNNGSLYLCTADSPIPKSAPGDFQHLWKFLRTLLGEGVDPHYGMQMNLFLSWLRHAVRALERRDCDCPSRLLILTGEHGNGKSTVLSKILAPAFGGRTASAKLMLSGKTGFNSELAEAELVTFDDIPNSLKSQELASTLKTFLVGHELGMQIHQKFMNPATIPVLHRLVWCSNSDANSLKHLPKMSNGDGLIDKVITLFTYRTDLSAMSGDAAQFSRNMIAEQVPSFLHWLMSQPVADSLATIPIDGRGPKAWMHPSIESELLEMSAEHQLLEMIQALNERDNIWNRNGDPASFIDLMLDRTYQGRYARLCGNTVRLGLLLSSLAQRGIIQKVTRAQNSKSAHKWILTNIGSQNDGASTAAILNDDLALTSTTPPTSTEP